MEKPSPAGAASCLVLAVGATLAAQRADCTGTVRDGDGARLAAAEVTFVQEPGQVPGGTPDRVSVRTGADGSFGAALLRGSPYVVWVIGPAEAEGARWLGGPEMSGAAGKRLDLLADQRGAPVRMHVRGAAPWLADGPLALRMLVGGQFALGPDIPLPGDMELTIGPWPDDEAALALVDGNSHVIERVLARLGVTREVTFTPVRELAVEVIDDGGKPVAGVAITVDAVSANWWMTARDVLPTAWRASSRVGGRTDREGHARVRVPWPDDSERRDLRLVAEHPEFGSSLSGYTSGQPYCDGQPGGDDDTLRFVMRRRLPLRVAVQGVPPDARVFVEYLPWIAYSTGAISGAGILPFAAAVTEGVAAAQVPARSSAVGMRVCVQMPDGLASRRIAPLNAGDLDLSALRRQTVVIVDAEGEPVPFAHFVMMGAGPGMPAPCIDRCLADEAGRVEFATSAEALRLVATEGARVGVHDWAAVAAAGDRAVRLRLESLPAARLRVLDAAGGPVAGARIDSGAGMRVARPGPARPYGDVSWSLMRAARSARDGTLVLPLPEAAVDGVIVHAGLQRSRPQRIVAGTEVVDVVVQ